MRRRKKNGAGSAVLGFIAGGLFPPLGVGSALAGYQSGTFWGGASWGAGISLLLIGAVAVANRASSPMPTLGASVHVGTQFTALVDSRARSVPNGPPITGGAQSAHLVATAIDPVSGDITAAVADPSKPLAEQGFQLIVPAAAVTAIG